MIKESSGYLQSNNIKNIKTHEIYYTMFKSVPPVKGTVLILHGLQVDSSYYVNFARYLAFQGFSVLTYDHLGHGKTAKSKEQKGFFMRKNAKEQLIYDAKLMAEFLENSCPDVPLFIIGHSMGSLIARCLLRQSSIHFNGAVIIGTDSKPIGIGLITGILYFLDAIAPHYRSSLMNRLFLKLSNRPIENEVLTSQKVSIQNKIKDITLTNNVFYTLFSLIETATENHWTKSISKQFPFLFVNDTSTHSPNKEIQSTFASLKSKGFKNVDCTFYPDARNKTPNKTMKKQLFENISFWLNKVFEELPFDSF